MHKGLGFAVVLVVGCNGGGNTAHDAPTIDGKAIDAKAIDAKAIDAPDVAADDAVPAGVVVTGSGSVVPSTAGNTLVFWSADQGSGDYLYKYGDGTSAGATYTVGFTTPVPAAATFSGAFGVGEVALVQSTFTLPDGKITDQTALQNATLGYSAEYAFIFRGAGAPAVAWLTNFPVGLSCGKCVHSTTGGFDTFMPIACTAMQVEANLTTAQTKQCNWT